MGSRELSRDKIQVWRGSCHSSYLHSLCGDLVCERCWLTAIDWFDFYSESGLDDPITQPTNRGNKLRANAKYVHEGALGCRNGKEYHRKVRESLPACLHQIQTPHSSPGRSIANRFRVLRLFQKAEHAGYKRDILEYNPRRYDSEGDELDFDDSDANADAEAVEENPYADLFLQGKLTAPAIYSFQSEI